MIRQAYKRLSQASETIDLRADLANPYQGMLTVLVGRPAASLVKMVSMLLLSQASAISRRRSGPPLWPCARLEAPVAGKRLLCFQTEIWQVKRGATSTTVYGPSEALIRWADLHLLVLGIDAITNP